MPITDYAFQDRIFSCKEVGSIAAEDAKEWADRLKAYADQSSTPIVALVDALDVTQIPQSAVDIFSKASFTSNLIAVVVATSAALTVTSKNIGLLGKRNQTIVFKTLKEAQEHAAKLVAETVA